MIQECSDWGFWNVGFRVQAGFDLEGQAGQIKMTSLQMLFCFSTIDLVSDSEVAEWPVRGIS